MAALNELIQKVENPELRAQLQAAADKLAKQKKFGLVFEEHLPECTPLYDIPVRKGAKVSVRSGKANETYTVLKIENDIATCLPRNSKEALKFSIDELIMTAELGDPIYPCLQPLGEVCNAPDTEGCWQISADTARNGLSEGTVRIGAYNRRKDRWSVSYLRKAEKERIARGEIEVTGKDENGALILQFSKTVGRIKNPVTVWNQRSHNAGAGGSNVLRALIPGHAFAFPKSVYAVLDTIRFVVAKKPNALVVDFFAGSGTTLHAVNLLNAEDGGHRRCIMVTNNEISAEERKDFEARGIRQGDAEWEARGIARYVTWPRTVCSIEGHDVNGNLLKGNYIGSDIPMADGFKANAAFFKLGFLDKTKVSLGMQFKELLSTLWMKAGAIGRCPVIDESVPDMLILPENKMAILNDENRFGEFAEQLAQHPEIEVVYLVTDYESSFVAMTQELKGKTTYQLYRDYLDNFRINAGRNSR